MCVLPVTSCRLQEAKKLHSEGDPRSAIKKLTRAIVLDQRNADLFLQRAEVYVSLEDYHSAIINYQKVLSLRPSEEEEIFHKLAAVHSLHGQSLMSSRRYEQALRAFDRALGCSPGEKEYVMKRIECLLELQRYGESLKGVEAELATDETNPQLYLLHAQLNKLFGNVGLSYPIILVRLFSPSLSSPRPLRHTGMPAVPYIWTLPTVRPPS